MKIACAQLGLFAGATLAAPLLVCSCGGGGSSAQKLPSPPLSITTESLPAGTTEEPYGFTLTATGGTPPYTWSVAPESNPLPNGLILSAMGYLHGVPTAVGEFSLAVRVADSSSKTSTKGLALKIMAALKITTNSLPSGIVGQPYTQVLQATGGAPPYTWSLTETSHPLPSGLTLNADGLISGVPDAIGGGYYDSYNMTVQVQDSESNTATVTLSVYVTTLFSISTTSLPDGNIGVEYQGWISFSGGMPPWYWTLAPDSNPLPAGLTLGETHPVVMGTPTQTGSFNFTVQGRDSSQPGQVATSTISLFIDNRLTVPSQQEFYGVIQRSFEATPVFYGGTPPITWSYFGFMPPGLSMDPSTGRITGTPSEQGDFFIGLLGTDSSNPPVTDDGSAYLHIRPPLGITRTRLDDGVRGRIYRDLLAVSGGMPPFTLEIVAGSLPPGLAEGELNPQGGALTISGVPTELGEFHFTVRATDSLSPPDTVTADITIRTSHCL